MSNFRLDNENKPKTAIGKDIATISENAWVALIGIIPFAGSIYIFQEIFKLKNISQTFASDVDKIIFIENWMSIFALIFFALGWFLTHWMEVSLSKEETRLAKVLYWTIWIGSQAIYGYPLLFGNNSALNRFGFAFMLLVLSGYFLRFSTFHPANVSATRKMLFFGKQ